MKTICTTGKSPYLAPLALSIKEGILKLIFDFPVTTPTHLRLFGFYPIYGIQMCMKMAR